jgi:sugar phosphate isomerase/epimerase
MTPVLACPNIIDDLADLREFALDLGFRGVDWSLNSANVPRTQAEEMRWIAGMKSLKPLMVRFHCFFPERDLASSDADEARQALGIMKRVVGMAAKAVDRAVLTIHLGLNRSEHTLSWGTGIEALRELVRAARTNRATICLENLIGGWTGRADAFSGLVKTAGCKVTFDIGHAVSTTTHEAPIQRIREYVSPHSERVINAHVYHRETSQGHLPPGRIEDVEARLRLISELPLCDWWVLELRDERALLKTLGVVQDFLENEKVKRAG